MNETAPAAIIFESLHGRVKSIDFQSGRVEIANKAKDGIWVRKSRLLELASIAVKGTPAQPAYIDFELDGRIVEGFGEHTYG